jgi:hypothetical protein
MLRFLLTLQNREIILLDPVYVLLYTNHNVLKISNDFTI